MGFFVNLFFRCPVFENRMGFFLSIGLEHICPLNDIFLMIFVFYTWFHNRRPNLAKKILCSVLINGQNQNRRLVGLDEAHRLHVRFRLLAFLL